MQSAHEKSATQEEKEDSVSRGGVISCAENADRWSFEDWELTLGISSSLKTLTIAGLVESGDENVDYIVTECKEMGW